MSNQQQVIIDTRGADALVCVYEDDRIPLLFEVPANLTGATVEMKLFGLTLNPLSLVAPTGLKVEIDTGLQQVGTTVTTVAKVGYSVVSIRKLTTVEWDDLRAKSGGVPFELRYEIPGTVGDVFSGDEYANIRGTFEITKRVGS